ncbi:hypothetical protein [Naasia aerilata]|uniref:Uncharacterized protein n=1 Tax=Naasia aerilata TaxID=1162966 RepID=A0ABN6XHN8_9MICO|nr:hypothetical protein [Naasia aerilata]BDZ44361.1 hypothetical protein GCM10025866_02700 [Naasia aerilata]
MTLAQAAAAAAPTLDPLVALLFAGVSGAVVAGAGGLVGIWLQGRREHQRWKREERLRAYVAFLRRLDQYNVDLRRSAAKGRRFIRSDTSDVISTLVLLGPRAVADAGRDAITAMLDKGQAIRELPEEERGDVSKYEQHTRDFNQARSRFLHACQKELGLS